MPASASGTASTSASTRLRQWPRRTANAPPTPRRGAEARAQHEVDVDVRDPRHQRLVEPRDGGGADDGGGEERERQRMEATGCAIGRGSWKRWPCSMVRAGRRGRQAPGVTGGIGGIGGIGGGTDDGGGAASCAS